MQASPSKITRKLDVKPFSAIPVTKLSRIGLDWGSKTSLVRFSRALAYLLALSSIHVVAFPMAGLDLRLPT